MNISSWSPVWKDQNSWLLALARKNKIRRIFNLDEEKVPF